VLVALIFSQVVSEDVLLYYCTTVLQYDDLQDMKRSALVCLLDTQMPLWCITLSTPASRRRVGVRVTHLLVGSIFQAGKGQLRGSAASSADGGGAL
jgi:hypothetical protein